VPITDQLAQLPFCLGTGLPAVGARLPNLGRVDAQSRYVVPLCLMVSPSAMVCAAANADKSIAATAAVRPSACETM